MILFIYAFRNNTHNKIIWHILNQFKFELLIYAIVLIIKENNRVYTHKTDI